MTDFQETVRRWNLRTIAIGIDRGFARRFFTDQRLSTIEQRTGERPVIAWTVVFSAFLVGPIALIVSLVLAATVLRGWSLLAVPVGLIVYGVNWTRSVTRRAGLVRLSFALAASILVVATDPAWNWAASAMSFTFVLGLWAVRFTYVVAPRFLRALVLRNHRAFELLREHIVIRAVQPGEGTVGEASPP